MGKNKRLFLFAGYDKNGIIDDALILYVSQLSKIGDVILCMDCDCPTKETNKIKKYTINTTAKRHGEYDFGSYKRCFQYAESKDILKDYDFVYLVNDSVFGPMFNVNKTIKAMEQNVSDATGIIVSKHKTHSFMESWFIKLNKKIFLSDWFKTFISNVTVEKNKETITIKYEHGLTNLIKNNGYSWSGIYTVYGRYTYNNPKSLFKLGCPFVKRATFIRHNGDCGSQIKYILNNSDKKISQSILNTANRIYGHEYMKKFLTYNPIKISGRKIRYLIQKIKSGQI